MKIIISPAKNMKVEEYLSPQTVPVFLANAKEIAKTLQSLTETELAAVWKIKDKLLRENIARLTALDFKRNLTPAILSYDGIQYKYMMPSIFTEAEFSYIAANVRILSALYGVLRPLDSVALYRLEMQAKLEVGTAKNLYAYWGERLYQAVLDDSRIIVNLASTEYSKAISKYLTEKDQFITCTFGELVGEKVVQKGVYAKMARGEMVRYLAVNDVQTVEGIKGFDVGYSFDDKRSTASEFVFIKK